MDQFQAEKSEESSNYYLSCTDNFDLNLNSRINQSNQKENLDFVQFPQILDEQLDHEPFYQNRFSQILQIDEPLIQYQENRDAPHLIDQSFKGCTYDKDYSQVPTKDHQRILFSRNSSSSNSIIPASIAMSESERNKNNFKREKKILFSQYLINKYLHTSGIFSDQKRFYIFSDQVIDINYFKNINSKENYLKQMSKEQLHKGLRFINKITHRRDNKFIEADLEYYPSQLSSLEQITQMIMSLGNKDLIPSINDFNVLWERILKFKAMLQEEDQNPIFQEHFDARNKSCLEQYEKIISKLDQNEMIYHVNYTPNHKKCVYESKLVGYSPELYEILAQNSYKFQDILQKNGCYDPRTQINHLDRSIQEASGCLQAICLGYIPSRFTSITETDIITCDDFIFPAKQICDVYILNDEYDSAHGLTFKSKSILAVNTFKFLDEEALANFKKLRNQQEELFKFKSIEETTLESLIFNEKFFSAEQLAFFEKYYQNSITDLYNYGNKWLKRCGFVNIPKKKKKLQPSNNDNEI